MTIVEVGEGKVRGVAPDIERWGKEASLGVRGAFLVRSWSLKLEPPNAQANVCSLQDQSNMSCPSHYRSVYEHASQYTASLVSLSLNWHLARLEIVSQEHDSTAYLRVAYR